MGTIDFITQGFIEGDDHYLKIRQLLAEHNLIRAIFSIAFVKTSGIHLISDAIKSIKPKLTIFAGIRNGITSIQAIFDLIDLGVSTYLVDTGIGTIVYHPKLYLFEYSDCYKIMTGSANLTGGGLNSNIEISSICECAKDEPAITRILENMIALPAKYAGNVFEIKTKKEAFLYFKRGLLTDERFTAASSGNAINHSKKYTDHVPRIKLKNKKISKIYSPNVTGRLKPLVKPAKKYFDQWVLVWESNDLAERDLNIPSGSGTNPTGSMLFKKGNTEGIDQRTYFRNEVFHNLTWTPDQNPKKSHLERAVAEFQFEIRGINYGIYNLKLTHNTNTASLAYQQSNSMTQIHWGEAKEIIAHRELLGEKIELYRNNSNPLLFRIKIG